MKSHAKSLSVFSVNAFTGTQTASRTLPNWKRNVTSGPSMMTGTLPTALPTLAPQPLVLLPLLLLLLQCCCRWARFASLGRSSCASDWRYLNKKFRFSSSCCPKHIKDEGRFPFSLFSLILLLLLLLFLLFFGRFQCKFLRLASVSVRALAGVFVILDSH